MNTNIEQAQKILREGGIVIFPTDTVYGIGCRLDNEEALRKLFTIRNRPEEKAVLAVVDSVKMAEQYVAISEEVKEKLIKAYWPGGLTIVLPCYTEKIPAIARGGGVTLAVRQTGHPVLVELIQGVGVPIVAPSANFAGQPTPRKFEEIDPELKKLVDFVLDEPTGGNKPSTLIDCTVNPWKILRQGVVEVSPNLL